MQLALQQQQQTPIDTERQACWGHGWLQDMHQDDGEKAKMIRQLDHIIITLPLFCEDITPFGTRSVFYVLNSI